MSPTRNPNGLKPILYCDTLSTGLLKGLLELIFRFLPLTFVFGSPGVIRLGLRGAISHTSLNQKKPPANVHDGSEVTADSDDKEWKKKREEQIARHQLEMDKWKNERGLWYVFRLEQQEGGLTGVPRAYEIALIYYPIMVSSFLVVETWCLQKKGATYSSFSLR